jgi:anion-transporting  ArsA/GET3 family ATPase
MGILPEQVRETMKATSPLAMRLLLVSGKGGAGKTTVSASLALAAAKRGKRVLLIEVSPWENFTRLFEASPGGHAEIPIAENIWALNLDPYLALEEYLETQLHTRRVVKMITGNPFFRRLVEIAPGWRDLITLGKVWHLERQRDPKSGRPKYDLLIVDAPATGQGLAFLQTPNAFVKAIRFGPPKTHSQWVRDLVEDRKRTRLLIVTLPEELPVNEAIEMVGAADRLKIPFEQIVVNAVAPKLFTEREARAIEAIKADGEARARLERALDGEVGLDDLLETAEVGMKRRAMHVYHIRRLRAQVHKPLIKLPFVYRSDLSLEDLRALGEIIVEHRSAA